MHIFTNCFVAQPSFPKVVTLFLVLSIGHNTGFSQPISSSWNKPVTINPYNTHDLGDKIALIGTDENGETALSLLKADGDLEQNIMLPQVEALGSSLYDSTNHCFYIMGSNEDVTIMRLLKISTDGSVIWQRNKPFSGFRLPYKVTQYENQLAFTFAQLNTDGQSTGIGWWLLDTAGNTLSERIQPLPPSTDPVLPFTTVFDPIGRLIMAASNLKNGACSVFSFNPLTGIPFWEKKFAFQVNSTIDGMLVDEEGNIYITGENGFLVKLDVDGAVIFNQQLGYDSISFGNKILEHNGSIYVLGGWRDNFDSPEFNGRMLVGKYSILDGTPDWVWIYDHTGINHGPIASDGFFKNDSTLVIQFLRLFESDWIGAFHLNQTSKTKEIEPDLPLSILPNPTYNGTFRLEGIDPYPGNVKVIDATGDLQINMPYLPSETITLPKTGIFVVEYTNGKIRKTAKVISIK